MKRRKIGVKFWVDILFIYILLKLWNCEFVLCFDFALLSFIFNNVVDVCIHNI